jgi:hypothetical protein
VARIRAARLTLPLGVCAVVALVVTALLVDPSSAQVGPPPAPNTALGRVYRGAISLPFVLPTARIDYLYSSGFGPADNIELRTFTKMGRWSKLYNPLPQIPPWVVPGSAVWSPDVRKVGGGYVMWFSALARTLPPGDDQTPPPRCLGWARSASLYGPFVTDASRPAICQWSQFGDIDPRTFEYGGHEYLFWKSDDNAGMTPPGHTYKPTKIWVQELAANGTKLEGPRIKLLQNTERWEGIVVEAPDMVEHAGRFYLFFSSTYSFSQRQDAGIGVAMCDGPLGPCDDPAVGPWLGSNTNGTGPDEESLFEQDGAFWLLYSPQAIEGPTQLPSLAVSRVAFRSGQPYLATFDGAQPNP